MLQRQTSFDGVVFYASPLLNELRVPHAFSTRIGGISPAPFHSLNLGNPSGCERQDDGAHIQENYRRLQKAINHEHTPRAWVHQVHAAAVEDAAHPAFTNGRKADALITHRTDQILAIRIADCVPVLLADSTGSSVAAVHAGWRGIVAGVIPAAIQKLNASNLTAAVGPCISADAFEVGTEVLEEFRRLFQDIAPISSTSNGKGHVDLRAACRLQLLAAGVHPDRIDMTDRCTFRHSDEFFSHRRDNGITGRMAALIAPRST